jgi:hypothetical protein
MGEEGNARGIAVTKQEPGYYARVKFSKGWGTHWQEVEGPFSTAEEADAAGEARYRARSGDYDEHYVVRMDDDGNETMITKPKFG